MSCSGKERLPKHFAGGCVKKVCPTSTVFTSNNLSDQGSVLNFPELKEGVPDGHPSLFYHLCCDRQSRKYKRPQSETAALVSLYVCPAPASAPVREEPAPPVVFLNSCHNLIACKIAYNLNYNARIARLFFQQIAYFFQEHNLITGWWRGSRSSRCRFFFPLEIVHGFDHHENTEGNNQKIDDVLNEHPVVY